MRPTRTAPRAARVGYLLGVACTVALAQAPSPARRLEAPPLDETALKAASELCPDWGAPRHGFGGAPEVPHDEIGECTLVVATVAAVRDEGATQAAPPTVLLKVEEVLTGDLTRGLVPAVWRAWPYASPCRVGEPGYKVWRTTPMPGPAVGERFLVAGALGRNRRWFLTRPSLRLPFTPALRAQLQAQVKREQQAWTRARRAEVAARRAEARAAARDDELVAAVTAQDAGRVKALLREGVRPTARDPIGYGALHLAAELGATGIVRALLDAGAPVDVREEFRGEERTALSIAASAWHLDTVKLLLTRGANPRQRLSEGQPLLAEPARTGDCKVVSALLAYGARADAAGDDGTTPLLLSASGGHEACVTALLRAGARLDRANRTGVWPLHAALRHPEVLQLLLRAGASPHVRDAAGETPLQAARRHRLAESARVLEEAGARR